MRLSGKKRQTEENEMRKMRWKDYVRRHQVASINNKSEADFPHRCRLGLRLSRWHRHRQQTHKGSLTKGFAELE